MLSGLILIGRGLDQVFEVKIESRIESESSCELIVIFSFEGTIGETRSTFDTSGDDDGEVVALADDGAADAAGNGADSSGVLFHTDNSFPGPGFKAHKRKYNPDRFKDQGFFCPDPDFLPNGERRLFGLVQVSGGNLFVHPQLQV